MSRHRTSLTSPGRRRDRRWWGDDLRVEPARRLQTVAPRWWRPVFVGLLAVAAGVVVLGLVLPDGWTFLPMSTLFVLYAWMTWKQVHAGVDLDEDGMTVRRFRRRRLAWADVRVLRLDPRGGPRLLSAELARGELFYLPLLDEAGTEAVLVAHAAASERA